MKEVKDFHEAFYATKNKLLQDSFILKHCSVDVCKRRRPKNETREAKVTHVKCFVRNYSSKENVPVCQSSFLKILQVTKHRVAHIMKSFTNTGQAPTENRGGDRKTPKYEDKQAAVQRFINSFKCIESHYCRSSTKRLYLPSDLSIQKMHSMYDQQACPEEKVKLSYFRTIFNTKYNLSFTTPRTDVCSTCLELTEKIKRCEDEEERNKLSTDKKIHKLRADAFFNLLKEARDDLVTISFDCEKNLVLPKVPDQTAYYSRQLYLYNFTIVQGTSKSQLNPGNVFSYYWTENEFAKSSNEVSSAVFDRLKKIKFSPRHTTVRLMADGCSGQNKNSTLIGMCSKWLANNAPLNVKNLEVIFPVVGHSFLPADRVFGHIEKSIKKLEVITEPDTYIEIFSRIATPIRLGPECTVHDWKKSVTEVLKPPGSWHFQFKNTKRFYLKRSQSGNVLVRGELHYLNDLQTFQGVTKKGKSVGMIKPDLINTGMPQINSLKLTDVNKLLTKHFGKTWRDLDELRFYNDIIDILPTDVLGNHTDPETLEETQDTEDHPIDQEPSCEFIPEIPSVLV